MLYEQCSELDDLNQEKINDIKNDLLVIFKSYGTYNIYDFLYLLGDKELIDNLEIYNKYELMKDIVHPIGFKKYPKSKKKYTKPLNKLKLIDDTIYINGCCSIWNALNYLRCLWSARIKKNTKRGAIKKF